MKTEIVYSNNKVIVSDEKGRLDVLDYKDNIVDELQTQNNIEELGKIIDNNNIEKESLLKKIKEKKLNRRFTLLVPFIPITANVIAALFSYSDGIHANFNGINIILLLTVITEVPAILGTTASLIYNNDKLEKKKLKIIEEEILSYKEELERQCQKIKEMENKKEETEDKYNDFDIIDINTKKIIRKKVLKRN